MLRFNCNTWPRPFTEPATCPLNGSERYCLSSSIRWYFKPTVNLPTTSHVQMSPSVLKRVNQEAKAALEREEAGRQANKKHKYNTSFTPEDPIRNC